MHLLRSFDDALMRAPDARGPADAALIAAVRTWCKVGAFPRQLTVCREAVQPERPLEEPQF